MCEWAYLRNQGEYRWPISLVLLLYCNPNEWHAVLYLKK